MTLPSHFTRQQSRDVDRIAIEQLGFHSLVLMENAARGCADVICEGGRPATAAIFCGKGNNGGDGLALARHLSLRGVDCQVWLTHDAAELSPDARVNWRLCGHSAPVRGLGDSQDAALREQLGAAEWVVDALLGTGAEGPLRPPLTWLVPMLNAAPGRRLAIDVPSGLDCETGLAAPDAFRAEMTCTFVRPKLGFQRPGAEAFVGECHVLDIGVPEAALRPFWS